MSIITLNSTSVPLWFLLKAQTKNQNKYSLFYTMAVGTEWLAVFA